MKRRAMVAHIIRYSGEYGGELPLSASTKDGLYELADAVDVARTTGQESLETVERALLQSINDHIGFGAKALFSAWCTVLETR